MWGKGDSEDSAPKEEKHTLRFHDLRLKPGHSYPCRRVRRDCKWRVFCGLPNDVCIFLWLQLLSRSTATAFWGPRRGRVGRGTPGASRLPGLKAQTSLEALTDASLERAGKRSPGTTGPGYPPPSQDQSPCHAAWPSWRALIPPDHVPPPGPPSE